MDKAKTEALKDLLSKYSKATFLRGKRVAGLDLVPEKETESGFLVFLVGKNGRRSILKILWREEFLERFKSELFIYKELGQIRPEIKNYLSGLISYSEAELEYLEIEYLDGYQPIGETHSLAVNFSEKELTKVLEAISSFHFVRNKLDSSFSLEPLRTYDFYMKKLVKLDTGERIDKYIGQGLDKKARAILEENKSKLLISGYLILGDRNPSNILIKDNDVKIIDFDRVGWGNPALDFTFLYIALIPFPDLTGKLLEFLKKKYTQVDNFWLRFWVDVLIRLVDEIRFWHDKEQKRTDILKSEFKNIVVKLK